jgi:hypothetical protein
MMDSYWLKFSLFKDLFLLLLMVLILITILRYSVDDCIKTIDMEIEPIELIEQKINACKLIYLVDENGNYK